MMAWSRVLAALCAGALLSCTESTEVLGLGEATASQGSGGSPTTDEGGGSSVGGLGGAPSLRWGEFSEPRLVLLGPTDLQEDDPSLSADGLELYFGTGKLQSADIWRARRESPTEAWLPPEPVDEINSEERDTTPYLAPDGLTLYFASSREGADLEIYRSIRSTRSAPWGASSLVESLNSELDDSAPQVSWDGSSLLLTRSQPGDFSTGDLFQSLFEAGSWSPPEPLSEVNSPDLAESNGILSSDGLSLFYSEPSAGRSKDLVLRTRLRLRDEFGPRAPLDTLNSEEEDTDPWLSRDGTHILFSSQRSGVQKIYESFREAL